MRVNLSHPNATTTLRDRHRVLFQTSYDIHFSIVLSFHLMSSLLGLLGLDVPTGHRGGGPTLLLRSIAARAPFRLRRAPQSEQTMNASRKRIAFIVHHIDGHTDVDGCERLALRCAQCDAPKHPLNVDSATDQGRVAVLFSAWLTIPLDNPYRNPYYLSLSILTRSSPYATSTHTSRAR
jgi:hypothetical protein